MKDKIRKDPILTKRPEMPLQGPLGKGGRMAASGTITQHIMKTLHKDKHREADPREALLKFAKESADEPHWVG